MAYKFNPFTGTFDQKLVIEGTSSELSGNISLNDGYISNDGGSEGISMADSGATTISVVDAFALQLNGTSDFINLNSPATLDDVFSPDSNPENAQFTIGAWINPSNTSGVRYIVSKFNAASNGREFAFYVDNGILKLKLAEAGDSTTSSVYSIAGFNLYSMLFNNNTDGIKLGATSLFSGSPGRASFSFWVKLTEEPDDVATIFTKDYYADTAINFTSTRFLRFYNGAGGPGSIRTTTALSIDTWYHIACTFGTGADGTGTGTAARIYINGEADPLDGEGGATYQNLTLWNFMR